jgi:FG-GAP repeat
MMKLAFALSKHTTAAAAFGMITLFVALSPTLALAAGPVTTLTASNGAPGDGFGTFVSVTPDGTSALIGAPGSASGTGAAYVFDNSGTSWTQQTELTASDGTSGDIFGVAVGLSANGNFAVVGAANRTVGGQNSAGTAYIFHQGLHGWSQQAEISDPAAFLDDGFGSAVAINHAGTIALISASGANNSYGLVYVYTRSGSTWSLQATLDQSPSAQNLNFGISVTLDGTGTEAAVGSQGAAYVFLQSGSTWTQEAELTVSGAVATSFGSAVSVDSAGTALLVGACDCDLGAVSGSAFIYTGSGATWIQKATLNPSDGAAGDGFGFSASISANGKNAILGSPFKNSSVGEAYIYSKSSGVWSEKETFNSPDSGSGQVGISVGLNSTGTLALVGNEGANSQTGAVDAFAP